MKLGIGVIVVITLFVLFGRPSNYMVLLSGHFSISFNAQQQSASSFTKMTTNQTPKVGKPYTKWSEVQDEHFIYFIAEQVKLGRTQPGGLTTEGWDSVEKEMNKLYGDKLDKTKMKNRMRTLKKIYATMKRMSQHSGFGWNEETRKVDVEDDVWEQYLVAHPKDSKYRTKTLPDYNTLALIFGDTVADGRNGCEINDVEDFQSEFTDDDIAVEKVTIPAEDIQFVDQDNGYFVQNMNFTSPEIIQSSTQEKRAGKRHLDEQPTLTSRPKRIKNSIGNSLAKSVDRWTAIAEEQIRLQHEPKNTSAEKLMPLILELDFDDEWTMQTVDLFVDKRNAEFFAAMPPELRKKWVMRKLGLY
ncbi:hypothetical protein H5410_042353 [Solanum commersonii]|uniref:Myb/SANT-like domain-containing protein n=1 Tax=Solanum commersonii TaxID=4109 RepID=A0A9J5XW53_SOLCO|nr:hypothetical protein H5410_042353 [Solanum commersonii]